MTKSVTYDGVGDACEVEQTPLDHGTLWVETHMVPSRNPRFDALLEEIRQLHNSKNHDYAGTDPLSNFKKCAALGVEPWRGVLVRMSDKVSRIEQIVGAGKVPKHESLRDSLIDLSVYSLLCILLLEEAR